MSLISYVKQLWDTKSYVNPTRMNHMEDGISKACDGVDEISANIEDCISTDEELDTTNIEIRDSDTLGGHAPEYFGTKAEITQLNSELALKKYTNTVNGLSITISKFGKVVTVDYGQIINKNWNSGEEWEIINNSELGPHADLDMNTMINDFQSTQLAIKIKYSGKIILMPRANLSSGAYVRGMFTYICK